MSDKITIRELETMPELNATVELQRAVWGMRDVEVCSPHTLRAIVHSGGAVFGAEAEGQLIGFCFGFAAWRAGSRGHRPADTANTPRASELWLWSHMAAVRPAFQGRGIGYRLKRAQRAWALKRGYRWMAWTFDPLQAGNANFNFNRLGVTARRYSANHYGEMQDGLNAGLASDRLEAQWELAAPQVIALMAGEHSPPSPGSFPHQEGRGGKTLADATMLVYIDAQGTICRGQAEAKGDAVYGIEIPADIAELKRRDMERAKHWQLHLRAAMKDTLAKGYIVSGFVRASGNGAYILSRTLPAGSVARGLA